MNTVESNRWAIRAFCYCEAALAEEIATPSQLCITEELVRSALVRGLGHTRPELAHRLRTEEATPYSGNPCWGDATHGVATGRPIQHDVEAMAVEDDAGAVFEVKWLKQNKAAELAKDIWKLAFARGEAAHAQARRTFLLVGGEAEPFRATLNSLRGAGADLRWSDAGRQAGTPNTKTIALDSFWGTALGGGAFNSLLGWGSNGHVRCPPDCPARMKATRRSHWLRTLPTDAGESVSWRLVLWEFHTFGLPTPNGLDWPATLPDANLGC